jgi:hypothetical protein
VDIQKHAFVGVPDGEKGVADGLRIKAVTIEELGCPGWPLAALGRRQVGVSELAPSSARTAIASGRIRGLGGLVGGELGHRQIMVLPVSISINATLKSES